MLIACSTLPALATCSEADRQALIKFDKDWTAANGSGDRVAIADVKATGKAAGQNVAPNMKATLVFQKTKDGMKVISGQATPVTASANRPVGNTNANSTANANTAANR